MTKRFICPIPISCAKSHLALISYGYCLRLPDVQMKMLVPGAGVEPARDNPRDFKSLASTGSATRARDILARYESSAERQSHASTAFLQRQSREVP